MPLNNTALNAATSAVTGVALFIQLHSADPTSAGTANATTHARVAAGWPAPTNGVATVTNKSFTGGAANGAVTWVSFWSASTAGTCYGSSQIPIAAPNDLASNAAGQYNLNSVALGFA